jgi:tetratricopeptide (TPR) repeat protein
MTVQPSDRFNRGHRDTPPPKRSGLKHETTGKKQSKALHVLALEVECCIGRREKIMTRLSRLKEEETTSRAQNKVDKLLIALRGVTLDAILAIEKWSAAKNGFGLASKKEITARFSTLKHDEHSLSERHLKRLNSHKPFQWRGAPYLSKIAFDCINISEDFDLRNHFGEICGLKGRSYCALRNPLYLPFTADELVNGGPIGPLSEETVHNLCTDATDMPAKHLIAAMHTFVYDEIHAAIQATHQGGGWRFKNDRSQAGDGLHGVCKIPETGVCPRRCPEIVTCESSRQHNADMQHDIETDYYHTNDNSASNCLQGNSDQHTSTEYINYEDSTKPELQCKTTGPISASFQQSRQGKERDSSHLDTHSANKADNAPIECISQKKELGKSAQKKCTQSHRFNHGPAQDCWSKGDPSEGGKSEHAADLRPLNAASEAQRFADAAVSTDEEVPALQKIGQCSNSNIGGNTMPSNIDAGELCQLSQDERKELDGTKNIGEKAETPDLTRQKESCVAGSSRFVESKETGSKFCDETEFYVVGSSQSGESKSPAPNLCDQTEYVVVGSSQSGESKAPGSTLCDGESIGQHHTSIERESNESSKSPNEITTWRTEFDNGSVPWKSDFDESRGNASHFSVNIPWCKVEQTCVDYRDGNGKAPHQQRVDFFLEVSASKVIRAAFQEVCDWHPKTPLIDGFKWANLARKMKFLPIGGTSLHEVDMIFSKQARKRKDKKLNLVGFRAVLEDLAAKRFRVKEATIAEETLNKMLWKTLVMLPLVNDTVWKEAKILAMKKEALRHCAQARIAALRRKGCCSKIYLNYKSSQITVGVLVRGAFARVLLEQLRRDHKEEARRVLEYQMAQLMQCLCRIFIARSLFLQKRRVNIHYVLDRCFSRRTSRDANRMVFLPVLPIKAKLEESWMMIAVKNLSDSCLGSDLLIYRMQNEFYFVAYNSTNFHRMQTQVSQAKLQNWISTTDTGGSFDISGRPHKNDMFSFKHQKDLVSWLAARILVENDVTSGQETLVLECDWNEERRNRAALVIQGLPKILAARIIVRDSIHATVEKLLDREKKVFYYSNKITGDVSWSKPSLLGPGDITDPPNHWRKVEGENDSIYYFNPCTGQTSWMSVEEAVRLVQSKFRSHSLTQLLGGCKLTFERVAKALQQIDRAEQKYKESPNKLASKVNFSLLNQCITFDGQVARRLYAEVIQLSPSHPVIARAYGIFILASCDEPRESKFNRALELFQDASVGDPDGKLFQGAQEHFFRWAAASQPHNSMALLNYALLQQCVLKNNNLAEKVYRKALSIDPGNEAILVNFEDFQKQRYPGGAFAENSPSYYNVRRSSTFEERLEWGEWVKMKDVLCPVPVFALFWFNKLTRDSFFNEPDWDAVWLERQSRSTVQQQHEGGWTVYFDEALERAFFHNKVTNAFVFDGVAKP